MEEYIDILNSKGEFTGVCCLKSIVHQYGLYHATVHIWFYTNEGQILLQKRASSKNIFPNLWDVSVAGHIDSGESPMEAAIRETNEEISITLLEGSLSYIGNYFEEKIIDSNCIDREFHFIYIAKLPLPLKQIVFEKNEISALKLLPINDLEDAFKNSEAKTAFVPHDITYVKLVTKALQDKIF